MTTAVHLDTSALYFYQDAPDNYCHFVLGNLFEVFVGLSENGMAGARDLPLTHNNVLSKFESHYSVFTDKPLQRLANGPSGARVLRLSPTANWSTLATTRDLGHYLKGFQSFIWERLDLNPPSPPRQVTLIRRNRIASNRYAINEPQLIAALSDECARRGATFEVVDFEGMSFRSQVELMSRTRVLIGMHGAGLVNAMFLPPEAAIVELLPHHKFEAHFFRFMGMSKGNRWIRILTPSWSVPSLYNLILAATRKGHTRKNRFYRDRNAVFEPASVLRALGLAFDPSGELGIDVSLTPEEQNPWRKLGLLRTHRKFLLGLATGGAIAAVVPFPLAGALVLAALAGLSFFV